MHIVHLKVNIFLRNQKMCCNFLRQKNIRQRLEGKLVKKVEKGYTRDNLK